MYDLRAKIRDYLRLTNGDGIPEWRVVFSTSGSDGPTGVAPVCTDDDHNVVDDGAELYECCPELDIECHTPDMASYLAMLLNEDRKVQRAVSPLRSAR